MNGSGCPSERPNPAGHLAAAKRNRDGALRAHCWAAALIFILGGCRPAPTEIFPLPWLASVDSGTGSDGRRFSVARRYFVVANAPSDRERIRRLVDNYLRSAPVSASAAQHTAIASLFFREGVDTPRDYAEPARGYSDRDRIEDHTRDLLVMAIATPGASEIDYRFFDPQELP